MSSKAAAMPEPKDDNEPSMEEILASIRKIIADDSLGTKKDEPAARKPEPKKAPEPLPEPVEAFEPVDVQMEEDADVLDLADVAKVAAKPQEVLVEPEMEIEPFPEMELEPVDVMIPPAPPPTPMPMRSVAALEERIVSENTGSLVSQAFQTLARNTPMPAVGRSLEDVVVEMLRPMLRGWLDDNLPGIVEKLVKAEIERVARG